MWLESTKIHWLIVKAVIVSYIWFWQWMTPLGRIVLERYARINLWCLMALAWILPESIETLSSILKAATASYIWFWQWMTLHARIALERYVRINLSYLMALAWILLESIETPSSIPKAATASYIWFWQWMTLHARIALERYVRINLSYLMELDWILPESIGTPWLIPKAVIVSYIWFWRWMIRLSTIVPWRSVRIIQWYLMELVVMWLESTKIHWLIVKAVTASYIWFWQWMTPLGKIVLERYVRINR